MANFENRTLFHGDNLPFLRAMNTGSVDLIATDPPFNKGRDFHATPDSLAAGAKFQDRWSWEDDVEGEWVDQITDDWPNVWNVIQGARESFGDDMGAFLCFMGVRLIAMRRVLRDDGSLYLHCDPTASHYLKQLLDAIFGRKQFRNEIVWQRAGVKGDARRKLGANHDLILVYGKSPSTHFEVPRLAPDSEYLTRFNLDDNDGRGTYHSAPLDSPSERPNLTYEYKGYPPPVKGWRVDRAEMQRLDDDGRLIFPRKSNGRIRRKLYLSEAPDPPAGDVWTDIPAVGSSNERMGYPTQKPLALYERIIEASSRGGTGCLTRSLVALPPASPLNGWAGSGLGSTCGTELTGSSSTASRTKDWPALAGTPTGCSLSGISPTPTSRQSAQTMAKRPPRSSRSRNATPSLLGRA